MNSEKDPTSPNKKTPSPEREISNIFQRSGPAALDYPTEPARQLALSPLSEAAAALRVERRGAEEKMEPHVLPERL